MRKWMLVALVLAASIWWLRSGDHHHHVPNHTHVQAAVLADGFAALVDKNVVEVDRNGRRQHEMALGVNADVRLVGTSAGTAVGWKDGKKLKLGILDSEGNAEDVSTWGKNVKQLCDGAASNEHRFGVGWLEGDGKVWFVHGPMRRLADSVVEAVPATTAKITWCGIASAEQNIMLMFREGGRLQMNICEAKRCTNIVVKIPIDSSETVLGYGCLKDQCLFASRDKQGTTKLHRVNVRGRALVKTLEHATSDTAVSIVGAGSRAYAIGYVAKDGLATVQRVTHELSFTNTWHFDKGDHAPTLAWAGDKLLVAMKPHGEAEQLHVMDVPR